MGVRLTVYHPQLKLRRGLNPCAERAKSLQSYQPDGWASGIYLERRAVAYNGI